MRNPDEKREQTIEEAGKRRVSDSIRDSLSPFILSGWEFCLSFEEQTGSSRKKKELKGKPIWSQAVNSGICQRN